MEETARRVLKLHGFREIRTPLFEESAVFTSSLGEAAEIVTKQMYLFEDRGGRKVALRPEGTASVVRAFIEHGLDKSGGLTRFYYMGPMFRAERPQAGRRRQFHQLGVEVFGSASPYQDAEVLLLLVRLLKGWDVRGWVLKLNSLGCRQDREAIIEQVRAKLSPHRQKLCEDCQVRFEKNPLRILDCKESRCQELSFGIDVSTAVCGACRDHFEKVSRTLGRLKIPFEKDPHMVRGLDYYTRTAFEVIHGGLGAQNALGGGGRYDDLVELMGGSPVPAVGFAVGLERVLMAQETSSGAAQGAVADRAAAVFVSTAGSDITDGLQWVELLREKGIPAVANLEERPLKRQLEQADKWGFQWVVIRGEMEREKGVFVVKNMASRSQEEIPEKMWLNVLQKRLNRS